MYVPIIDKSFFWRFALEAISPVLTFLLSFLIWYSHFTGSRYDVAQELNLIQNEIDASQRKQAAFSDLFTSRANVRALIISLGLMVFQQFSGKHVGH